MDTGGDVRAIVEKDDVEFMNGEVEGEILKAVGERGFCGGGDFVEGGCGWGFWRGHDQGGG